MGAWWAMVAEAVAGAAHAGTRLGLEREEAEQREEIQGRLDELNEQKQQFSARLQERDLSRQEGLIKEQQSRALGDVEQAQRDVRSQSALDLVKGRTAGRMEDLRRKQENFLRRGGN